MKHTQAQERAIYFFRALAERTGANWTDANSQDVADWITIMEREIASKVARSIAHSLTQSLANLSHDGGDLPTFSDATRQQPAQNAALDELRSMLLERDGTPAEPEPEPPAQPAQPAAVTQPLPVHQVTQRWDVRSTNDMYRLVQEVTEARRALREYREGGQPNPNVERGLTRLVEVAERELHDYQQAREALLGSTYATNYAQGATTHG
jgi:hypothetical protein